MKRIILIKKKCLEKVWLCLGRLELSLWYYNNCALVWSTRLVWYYNNCALLWSTRLVVEKQKAMECQHQQACGTQWVLLLNPIISSAPASSFKGERGSATTPMGRMKRFKWKTPAKLLPRTLLKWTFRVNEEVPHFHCHLTCHTSTPSFTVGPWHTMCFHVDLTSGKIQVIAAVFKDMSKLDCIRVHYFG